MPNAMKRFRLQMTYAIFVAILASGPPLTGAHSQPDPNRVAKWATGKQWHLKYMGGPNRLKRGTNIVLDITKRTITYATAGRRMDQRFSIPVGALTDVSDETIDGDLSEKVLGPGEPDYISPCASVRDAELVFGVGGACVSGGLALETPVAIVATVLQNIPFKDHFVRLKWQANGEDHEVVFKVSGKDHLALRGELERVTGEGRREEQLQRQAARSTIYDTPLTHIEEFDRKTTEAHVQQWLIDQCQAARVISQTGSGLPRFSTPPPVPI